MADVRCTKAEFLGLLEKCELSDFDRTCWCELYIRATEVVGTMKADPEERQMLAAFIRRHSSGPSDRRGLD